jgi:zinc transport system substrate-binding protein
MKRFVTQALLTLSLLVQSNSLSAAPVKIFVSIQPQKYFVEKIGGKLVDISVMVAPGASPAIYEPKPQQMVALTRTKIYFAIGVPFESAWLEKIASSNPEMLILHSEAGVEKILMTPHQHYGEKGLPHYKKEGHDRENEGLQNKKERDKNHHRGIKDPHVWLSPPFVMIQARNILKALVSVDPAHRSVYNENYKNFIIELVELDEELRKVFTGQKEGIEFMVFHPSWGYFARAYGLVQVPIEIEGKEPKPAELENLIEHARARGIKVIFAQPQFSSQTAETIANSIGGQVVFVDPLALDWANNLREVARKFRAAIR